jgi:HAE1 family hydrophobic/amphiphilic exporter-1
LVLAIGIVVDDAIVVVENVERNLREGMAPREAAHKTMDEVGGALVAIALVLAAVFVPAAFISGISGQFFRQFAVTIAAATSISLLISLTLSPALCAILLKPHTVRERRPILPVRLIRGFFRGFNWGFDKLSHGYGALTRGLIRMSALVLLVYAGLVALTAWQFGRAPTGFIPPQDQGYLIVVIQLPPGASLGRTDAVVCKAAEIILKTKGISHAVPFAGLDGATLTNAPNAAAIFSVEAPFRERAAQGLSGPKILANLQAALGSIQDAFIITISPPPVRGIGTAGGFKLMVEDKRGRGLPELNAAIRDLIGAANQQPELAGVFSVFNTGTPTVYANIDRVRAEKLGVTPDRVFEALEVYLGSAYVNQFNYLGRTYQVLVQAEGPYRRGIPEVSDFKARNDRGQMVPLGSVTTFENRTGPYRLPRYNLYPAGEVQGSAAPGYSTGQALAAMERLAADRLPDGLGFEWTELAYQEKLAGNTGLFVFAASVVFVFLVLAAQYESWSLPLSVILIVPMCLLAAVSGLLYRGMDVDILAQVGFIVLVGLAAKNAILIVEFARQGEAKGHPRAEAAIEAARVRLRPILMTSFAFIFGVLPLAIAVGAGAEMRQALGTAVFFGMLGVTGFGLLFTPTFFVVIRSLFGEKAAKQAAAPKP